MNYKVIITMKNGKELSYKTEVNENDLEDVVESLLDNISSVRVENEEGNIIARS